MTTPPQGPATPPPAAPLPPRPALARSVDVLVSLGALAAIAYCAVATFWPGLLRPNGWTSSCSSRIACASAGSWSCSPSAARLGAPGGGSRPLGRLRKLALVGLPVAAPASSARSPGSSDSGLYHAFVVLIFLVVAAGGVANLLDALAPGAPWGLPWPAPAARRVGVGLPLPERAGRGARRRAAGDRLATYAGYRSTHDLPDPWWATFSKAFRYTPEQGPS